MAMVIVECFDLLYNRKSTVSVPTSEDLGDVVVVTIFKRYATMITTKGSIAVHHGESHTLCPFSVGKGISGISHHSQPGWVSEWPVSVL